MVTADPLDVLAVTSDGDKDPLDVLAVSPVSQDSDPLDVLAVTDADPLDALAVTPESDIDPLDALSVDQPRQSVLDTIKKGMSIAGTGIRAALNPLGAIAPKIFPDDPELQKLAAAKLDPLGKVAQIGRVIDPAIQEASGALAEKMGAIGLPSGAARIAAIPAAISELLIPTSRSAAAFNLPMLAEAKFLSFASRNPEIMKGLEQSIGAGAKQAAVKLADMTPAESVQHLSELARAAMGKTPIIKPVMGATIKETAINLLEREGRPKLSFEKVVQGIDDASKATMEVANEVARKIKKGEDLTILEGVRFFKTLGEGIRTNEIDATTAANWLQEPKIVDLSERLLTSGLPQDQAAFADAYEKIVSKSGYILGTVSRAKRAFMDRMSPAAKELFKQDSPSGFAGAFSTFNNIARSVEGFRSAAIVSQFGLQMRDFISTGAKYSIGLVTDSMSSVIGKLSGKLPNEGAFTAASQDIASLFHVSRGETKVLKELTERLPLQAQSFLGSPYVDLAFPGKFGKVINALHNYSFSLFGKAYADAFIRNRARVLGVAIEKLPDSVFKEAIDYARKGNLAKNYTSGLAGKYLDMYRIAPWLQSLLQKFPRAAINIMETAFDFSPLPLTRDVTEYMAGKIGQAHDIGILKRFGSGAIERLEQKDPRKAFEAISKSAFGTIPLAIGFSHGVSEPDEGTWYDLKVGNRSYDLRRWRGTGVAESFMIGRKFGQVHMSYYDANAKGLEGQEAVDHALWPLLKLKGTDWSEMLLGFNRTDMAGLPVIDAWLGSGGKTGMARAADTATIWFSRWVASFQPGLLVKTPKTIIGEWMQSERTPLYVRDRPFVGPMIQNIPFIGSGGKILGYSSKDFITPLSPNFSPTRSGSGIGGSEGIEEVDRPLLKELSGLVSRKKTPVEIELDRIGKKYPDVYPKTGFPQFDLLTAKYMGGLLEHRMEMLISMPEYLKASSPVQDIYLDSAIRWAQRLGKKVSRGQLSPHLMLEVMAREHKGMSRLAFQKQIEAMDSVDSQ